MSFKEQKPHLALDNLPNDWEGFTREDKINKLLEVINSQVIAVRSGTFDISLGERVAALILECQFDLVDLFTDAEASARSGKHMSELVEAEVSEKISDEADKKPAEGTLKRQALMDERVKESKNQLVDYERVARKWRTVYDLLSNHHILFRNITKLT